MVLGDTYDGASPSTSTDRVCMGAAHIVQTKNHIGDGTTGYQYPMLPIKSDARVWRWFKPNVSAVVAKKVAAYTIRFRS